MDSSLNSDMGMMDKAESGAHEICAPLEALQVNGTPPQEGDSVEVTVKGTVTRVEGDMAYLEPETFNDVPAPQGADSELGESDLRQQAQSYDQGNY